MADGIAGSRTDIQEDVFSGLAALEGADLRRLDSFLRKKDADKILGNLYRMTTETGHVKWVCLDHYRQVYREMAMESFLQCVETNGGTYDPYFGKTIVRLKSSTVAKDFFSRLSTQAPAVIGLNVTLDWQCDSADLMMLVDKVAQSNVQDMALVLKEPVSGTPLATRMKPGKGRYNSLLSLLSNVKIRSLALTDVDRLGLRTSSLPISNNSSLLQSFYFSGLIKTFDDARLAGIITHCRQLVDLRLGSRKWNGDETPLIDRAIGTLSGLKVLHRYCLYSGKYAATQGTSTCAPYGSVALREIVDFGLPYPSGPAGLLENVIHRSSATLEVLVLHSRQTPRTFNLADFISGSISAPASSDCLLFARLTHLEIFSNCKRDSVELFGSILPQLALIHLSVHAPTSVLLNHVNLKFLKSLNVKQNEEDVLNSFCDRARLSPNCQIESLRLCNIAPTPNLLDFLFAFPLRRLYLVDFGRSRLKEILSYVHLSPLRVLTIQDNEYQLASEAVLAARIAEFPERLEIHLAHDLGNAYQSVYDMGFRNLEGSSTRLPHGRVRIISKDILESEYSASVFPSPP